MNEQLHISVWNDCLRIIENILDSQQFATWFKPIVPVKLQDKDLTVEVPSHFFCEYIESTYLDLLRKTLQRVIGTGAKLYYQVRVVSNQETVRIPLSENTAPVNSAVAIPTTTRSINPGAFVYPGIQRVQINPQLNPVYNFANLVLGTCNKMGITAGLNIAQAPGKTVFNPLFLYGGSGLGKTHIAQAIGLEIKKLYPEQVVLYVPAHRFKVQYMNAVNAKNQLTDFLAFYQRIDVLIIDDIQELNSPGAKNAFFQVFNHLHQNGKQLIFTSDRPQVELQEFEHRLLSRLKWGLSVELTVPEYQTRLEMLRARALREGAAISDEVLEYLAAHIKTNFRELEGALISLIANSTFIRQEADLEMAARIVNMIVEEPQLDLSVSKVQDAVCEYFNIGKADLCSSSRKRNIVQARQIAMFLSRKLTNESLSSIGSSIGGKDHATVLHSCNIVTDLIDTDRLIKQYVTDIERILTGSAD